MTWKPLSAALATMPPVLAGPLLRKVTPETATVWLALWKPARVTLQVFPATPDGTGLLEGNRHTTAVGTNLHIVAVTATRQPPAAPLAEGVVYRYDLNFAFDDLASGNNPVNLAAATHGASLAYSPFTQPTFCLPPKDVNSLRLIHGSCRKPHAHGSDQLPLVDDLIAETAQTPLQRPHQLLLMGDQIYADDVSAAMLIMLTDASDALLWQEQLPLNEPGMTFTAGELSPFERRPHLAKAGFTSEDLDCHLLALGEFLAMYLFVWSDVLWSASSIAQFVDVAANLRKNLALFPPTYTEQLLAQKERSIQDDVKQLADFASGLTKVRRLLANIPTYMICDDHEVTDDWNMTFDIASALYGTPLGRRVVKNALVAYSLCQHWGNVPEQFDGNNPSLPGTTLLALLDGGNSAQYEANSTKIDTIVAVHADTQVKARGAVYHDPGSLTYNYTIEGLGHQVIVTDTRTWRSFPHGGGEQPDLLSPQQLVAQIQQIQPQTDGRLLLVVVTTNAPPVEPIRSATRHDWLANHFAHFPDIHDAWELPSTAFDRLIKSVTDRLPVVSGELYGPVLLLSGDVHTSFASRLLYKASARLEDPNHRPATAVIAQLVASALCNQTDETLGEDSEGYTYAPHWYENPLIPPHVTEYYAGWANVSPNEIVMRTDLGVSVPRLVSTPTTLQVKNGDKVVKSPDYIYQLDYLTAAQLAVAPVTPLPLPPLPPGATADQRKQALQAFNVATGNYRQYNVGPRSTQEIVGVNNVCELTFEWPSTDRKKVIHTVRWRSVSFPSGAPILLYVDYVVSLDPNDSAFPYAAAKFAVSP